MTESSSDSVAEASSLRPASKVCHLTSVHPVYDTRIFIKECRSLAKAGFDVYLVAPTQRDETIDGVKIVGFAGASSRLTRMTRSVWRVYEKARHIAADVYHFHDPELMGVGLLLRAQGRRVIFDIHENIREQIKMKSWLPCRHAIAAVYTPFDILVAKAFYLILAEDSYGSIYERYTSRYRVVRNMPDVDYFDKFNMADRRGCGNGILYVGGVTAERGIDVVLRALQILHARNIDFEFYCIGAAAPSLIRDITALRLLDGIEDKVRFFGRLELSDAYEVSRRCRVGVALLKPVGNYVTSYPTKVFEYMAISLPVVASNFQLYKSVVEHHGAGLCVNPEDPEAVADALAHVLLNPARAAEMGQNGRLAVERLYSWDAEARNLISAYEHL